MERILKSWPSPLAGDVLTSEHEAAIAGRVVFYDALGDSAPHVVEDLDSSCRDALRQTDRARLASAPLAMWPEVESIDPRVAAWAKQYQLGRNWIVQDAIWSLLDAEDTAGPSGGQLRLMPYGVEETTLCPRWHSVLCP